MSHSFLFFAAYLFAGTPAFSAERAEGPGSGGGGGAIVCLNSDQGLKSAELVDLVESTFYEKTVLSPALAGRPWEEQVELATARIAFADPQFHAMLLTRLQNVRSLWAKALEETAGTDLIFPAPQDLSHGRLPPMRLGCQLVGAAVYNDSPGSPAPLIVSSLIWNALPEIHKAALVLHEAIYRTHRDIYRNLARPDSPDSSATRALVGFLLSTELEQNSLTPQERERFSAHEFFRGYQIDAAVDPAADPFRARVRKLILPLLPFALKGTERPLYLDRRVFMEEELSIVLEDKDFGLRKSKCQLKTIAFVWPAKSKATVLVPVKSDRAKGRFEYKFRLEGSENALEDIRLTCETEGLHRYNPGFRVFLKDQEISAIQGTDRTPVTGLSVRQKASVEASFLRNIPTGE